MTAGMDGLQRLVRAVDWLSPGDLRGLTIHPRGLASEANIHFQQAAAILADLRGPLLIGRNAYHLSGVIRGPCAIGRYCSLSNHVDLAVPVPDGAGLAAGTLAADPPPTLLGCDVWMGYGACIQQGVRVGHGAVVGANAVVTGDVPPYGIVGGNPARLIRYRFDEPLRTRLLAAPWWMLPADLVARLRKDDIEASLRIAEAFHRRARA